MSHHDPGTDPQLDQDIAVPAERRPGSIRRYVAAFAAAALAAVGVGGAVWAWQSFMSQGAQPAEALPASTLAYAALDLDPPGGQKVEAFKTLQRFPSLKRELGLNSADDVQRSFVKQLSSDSGCKLDYNTVKAWLGDRAAVAVVQQHQPEVVVVLQVSDADRARAQLEKSGSACDFGFALHDDWAVLAKNDAVATQVVRDSGRSTLADDADYKRLTGAAGGAGLVTLYAAPQAGKALLDVIDNDPFTGAIALQMVSSALDPVTSFVTSFGLLAVAEPAFSESATSSRGSASSSSAEFGPPQLTAAQKKRERELAAKFAHYDELTKAQQRQLEAEQTKLMQEEFGPMDDGPSIDDPSGSDDLGAPDGVFPAPKVDPALRASLQKFTGLGGVGRFADHGLEVEVVGGRLNGTSADMYAGSAGHDLAAKLPKDSAIAFGAGLADGWVDSLFKQIGGASFYAGRTQAETVKAFEKSTGLDVPADLEALGGDGISVVAGPGLSPDNLFDNPAKSPVAVRVTGDAARIEAALAKLNRHRGTYNAPVLSERVGDDVVIGTDRSYLAAVAKGSDLGDSDDFRDVLPDADKATTVFYLNFDAGDWLTKAAGSDSADARPLHALGLSVTRTEGQQHVLLRLSFDD